MLSKLTGLFLGLAAVEAAPSWCPENSASVLDMPYLQEGTDPCQYAGFFHIEGSHAPKGVDHNLFYWFFRNQNKDAPLAVWVEGGPGSSGVFGIFELNGPLLLKRTGSSSGDDFTISSRPSWADSYHVLYIDQPVMTGFSYGDSTITDEEIGA
mmetsp:Transcript_19287/g.29583  ORF Transcript_19287/g.29583 Transcript_19287/m.29583 type:complete len:153 (+) Transcript_19287:15-473(+)